MGMHPRKYPQPPGPRAALLEKWQKKVKKKNGPGPKSKCSSNPGTDPAEGNTHTTHKLSPYALSLHTVSWVTTFQERACGNGSLQESNQGRQRR